MNRIDPFAIVRELAALTSHDLVYEIHHELGEVCALCEGEPRPYPAMFDHATDCLWVRAQRWVADEGG